MFGHMDEFRFCRPIPFPSDVNYFYGDFVEIIGETRKSGELFDKGGYCRIIYLQFSKVPVGNIFIPNTYIKDWNKNFCSDLSAECLIPVFEECICENSKWL